MNLLSNYKTLLIALVVATFLSSCKDDEESTPAPATEESSRDRMQENGLELTSALEELVNDDFVASLANLSELLATEPSNSRTLSATSNFIENIQSTVSEATTSTQDSPFEDEEDTETLEAVWEESVGTYTYNFNTDEFDFVKGGESIVLTFPSSDTETTNNATFEISDYTSTPAQTDIATDQDYEGELPTGIKASLSVDGVEGMGVEFSSEYNSDDIPTSQSYTVTLSAFELNTTLSSSSSSISEEVSFKLSDEILFSQTIEFSGNVSAETIDALNDDETDPSTVGLESITFTQRVVDTEMKLEVEDISAMISEGDNLIEPTDEEIENFFNNNIEATVYFADNGQVIGDTEISYERTEHTETVEYTYETYDEEQGQYVEVTESYDYTYEEEEIDLIMTYDDGSKVAVSDFFATGFQEVVDEFNRILEIEED